MRCGSVKHEAAQRTKSDVNHFTSGMRMKDEKSGIQMCFVQSQADLNDNRGEYSYFQVIYRTNLFGGYAAARKCEAFLSLALNELLYEHEGQPPEVRVHEFDLCGLWPPHKSGRSPFAFIQDTIDNNVVKSAETCAEAWFSALFLFACRQ